MRIAALGDIHSNHYALEACLDWIGKNNIDGIAFLGDYISDFPYPQKTIEFLRNIPQKYMTWFIRGNREDYMINHHKNPNDNWCYNSQSGSLLYTYENLTAEDIGWFEKMPICLNIDIIKDAPITICHGSPHTTRYLVYPNTKESDEIINNMNNELLICGHCHQAYIYTKNGKTIANGGAAGFPVNGQTKAQFVVAEFNGDKWTPEIISVEYNIEKAVEEFFESGLIDKANIWARMIIDEIRTGRNYSNECVELVSKLSQKRNLPFNDEQLWIEAYNSLDIKIIKE